MKSIFELLSAAQVQPLQSDSPVPQQIRSVLQLMPEAMGMLKESRQTRSLSGKGKGGSTNRIDHLFCRFFRSNLKAAYIQPAGSQNPPDFVAGGHAFELKGLDKTSGHFCCNDSYPKSDMTYILISSPLDRFLMIGGDILASCRGSEVYLTTVRKEVVGANKRLKKLREELREEHPGMPWSAFVRPNLGLDDLVAMAPASGYFCYDEECSLFIPAQKQLEPVFHLTDADFAHQDPVEVAVRLATSFRCEWRGEDGSTTDLRKVLKAFVPCGWQNSTWPRTSGSFRKRLLKITPSLERHGISIKFGRQKRTKNRITISRPKEMRNVS